MDTNLVLFWMTVAMCGSVAVRAVRARSRSNASFIAIPVAVVLVALAAMRFFPDLYGWLAAALCGLFVFLPPTASRWAFQLATRRRFRAARVVARLPPLLHPNAAFRELPSFVDTLEKLDRGAIDEVELRSTSRDTPLARFTYVQLLRAQGRWSDLVAFTSALPLAVRSTEPTLGYLHLRALGELGRIDEMLAEYARLETLPGFAASRDLLRLPIVARLGDVVLVDRLLGGRMASTMTIPSAAYWRASTLQAGGRVEAIAALGELTRSSDVDAQRAAARRLASPLVPVDVLSLSPMAQQTLHELRREVHSAAGLDVGRQRARMTWVIALSLFVVFLFELPGGTSDLRNLVDLGALVLPPIEPYDGLWRIVAAAWLHFGPLHLFMNVLGLVVIGRRVEAVLGPARLGVLFAGSAVLGNTVARVFLHGPLVLVGASGGVLGLLGVVLAIAVRRQRVTKTRYLQNVLRETLLVVGLQFVFDSVVPGVSSTVHIAGFVSGFLLGLVIPQRTAA